MAGRLVGSRDVRLTVKCVWGGVEIVCLSVGGRGECVNA